MSIFDAQVFFRHMLQMSMIPAAIQIAPLTAVTMGEGWAENSFNTPCQAMEVHARNPFHAVIVNTNRYSRVTRKGGLFMSYVTENL